MNLNPIKVPPAALVRMVSIPIRDLMNLNLCIFFCASAIIFVSIPIRDLMNLNPYCEKAKLQMY